MKLVVAQKFKPSLGFSISIESSEGWNECKKDKKPVTDLDFSPWLVEGWEDCPLRN